MTRDAEEVELAIDVLNKSKLPNGRYPDGAVRRCAEYLGMPERRVYRWAQEGIPDRSRRVYKMTKLGQELYVQSKGCKALAYRRLNELDSGAPSQRTYERAIDREFTLTDKAYVKEGEPGLIRMSTYLEGLPTVRNEAWQADTVDLDMWVRIKPNSKRSVRPKLHLIIDDSSGAIMGWAMSVDGTRGGVLSAIASALSIIPERGPFGGIPSEITVDKGNTYTCRAVKEAAVIGGFVAHVLPGRMPWLKGKIEARVKQVNDGFCRQFPHYIHGPKDRSGNPKIPAALPPSMDLVAQEFEAWTRKFNKTHRHRTTKETPLEAWEKQSKVHIRRIDPRVARALLKERHLRTIHKPGIRFKNRDYQADEFAGMREQKVTIAWMPGDFRHVDVFQDGKWICKAKAQSAYTEEDRESHRETMNAEATRTRRWANELAKSGKANYTPITHGGQQVEDSSVLTKADARRSRTNPSQAQEVARSKAQMKRLGLDHRVNGVRED